MNTHNFLFSDNFDASQVSKLSLFLFKKHYMLFAFNATQEVLSVIQEEFVTISGFQKLLKDHEIFQISCPKTVYWMDGNLLLVPEKYLEAQQSEVYKYFLEEPSEDYDIITTNCSNGISILNSIPNKLNTFFSSFADLQLISGAVNFFEFTHLCIEKKLIEKDQVFVSYANFSCLIAVFIDKKLHLFNRFSISNQEELLNYIFGITHQLGIQDGNFDIQFIGGEDTLNLSQSWINQYFHNGKNIIPERNFTYLGETAKIENHKNLEIFWQFIH